MGSLWIGPPDRLREFPDAARDYERTVELGVTEFRALSGSVTATSLATPPRRLRFSFAGLAEDDARWLEALARRVFGPLPLAVIDPAAVNLLDGPQSQGYGPSSAYQLTGAGTLATQADRRVTVANPSAPASLRWRHPHWIGWPVIPGVPVGFVSALAPAAGGCVLEWFTATGAANGTTGPAAAPVAVPLAGTTFVRPVVLLNASTTPRLVGPAWLSFGRAPETGLSAPLGDGCPAMVVTAYTDRPQPLSRDMSVDLTEVRRTAS